MEKKEVVQLQNARKKIVQLEDAWDANHANIEFPSENDAERWLKKNGFRYVAHRLWMREHAFRLGYQDYTETFTPPTIAKIRNLTNPKEFSFESA